MRGIEQMPKGQASLGQEGRTITKLL